MELQGSLCLQACQWSLPWGRWIQSTPSQPISLRSVLILSPYICLRLLSGLFLSFFLTKILSPFLICLLCVTWPAHLIILDLITLFGEAYKLQSFSLCNVLQPCATSSLLGPYVLLSTLFSNTVSESQNNSKIIVLYSLIFKCLERRQDDKRFWRDW